MEQNDSHDGLTRAMRWLEVPMNLVFYVALLAGALMMFHIMLDVGGRWLFGRPVPGTGEIVTYYYMVVASFLPWMWLARRDGHIKVDLVVRMLPRGVAFWLDLVVKAGLIAYLGLFAWQTWLEALRQTGRGEVQQAGGIYIPVWPTRWLLPIAAGLMALYIAFTIVEAILKRRERS